jgi:molybdopterin molybdotransferase/putative molybdopterin biosynthesis protein
MEFDTYSRTAVMEKLFSLWKPEPKFELVPLEEAVGRISAELLRSRLTLPVFRSSGGDGIAVRSADFSSAVPNTARWKVGEDYVRADTGDDFDDRFDAVIMIEQVSFNSEGGLALPGDITVIPGMNIRGRGSDIQEGDPILEQGLPIRPWDIGALAQGGLQEVPVVKKPVIAFIPTGNELVLPGTIPRRGQNIDTNSIMVRRMLLDMGAEPKIFPIIKDKPEEIKQALMEAVASSDVVIINAGSSRGSEDYNARLLGELGTLICHGVNAAPGRPLCMAVIDGKPAVNLPGPMMAAYFGMDWCIRGIACRALGIPIPVRPRVKATLIENSASPRKMSPGFELLCRISLTKTPTGWEAWAVPPFGRIEGKRTRGFHSGQAAISGTNPPAKGSEIEVELCYGPEFF